MRPKAVRVVFVGSGDFYRVDVDINGDARTVVAGADLNSIADAAMELRGDLGVAVALWRKASVVTEIEREISAAVDALAAW